MIETMRVERKGCRKTGKYLFWEVRVHDKKRNARRTETNGYKRDKQPLNAQIHMPSSLNRTQGTMYGSILLTFLSSL